MKKTFKKELSSELSKAIETVFSGHNKIALNNIRKHIEASGKLLAKKFIKAIKKKDDKKKKTITVKKKPTVIKKKKKS
jgi:hypothetical protein